MILLTIFWSGRGSPIWRLLSRIVRNYLTNPVCQQLPDKINGVEPLSLVTYYLTEIMQFWLCPIFGDTRTLGRVCQKRSDKTQNPVCQKLPDKIRRIAVCQIEVTKNSYLLDLNALTQSVGGFMYSLYKKWFFWQFSGLAGGAPSGGFCPAFSEITWQILCVRNYLTKSMDSSLSRLSHTSDKNSVL